jgi:L-cysteine/cystine lyase
MNARISRRRFVGESMTAALAGFSWTGVVSRLRADSSAPGLIQERLRPTPDVDEAYWRRVRREFNIVDDMVYMQNGTLGPMPKTVVDANLRYVRELGEDPRARPPMEPVREKLASFVGADPDEIVLTRSTTEVIKLFCQGLDLASGDEVVMCTRDHPAAFAAYRARERYDGIVIKAIELPTAPSDSNQTLSLYERAITPRTRVLLVSHVAYDTGVVLPVRALADLAHRRGLLISVDGAHGPGTLDLDMHQLGVDHYAAAGHKWLLAGSGTGLSYVRREIQDRVRTDMLGEDDAKLGARRYEREGQRHLPSALSMAEAVDFHSAIGKPHVEARIKQLANRLRTGLTDIPNVRLYTPISESTGGVTLFSVGQIPSANVVTGVFEQSGIYIVRLPDGYLNGARASTHIYNSPAEVDRLIDAVKYLAANPSRFMTAAH